MMALVFVQTVFECKTAFVCLNASLLDVKTYTDDDRELTVNVTDKLCSALLNPRSVSRSRSLHSVAMASKWADQLHETHEARDQEANRRKHRSDLPPDQNGRPASTTGRRRKQTERRSESLNTQQRGFQPDENAPHEATSLHENFAGIDGDDGLLEEPPDDPKGASFDDLRTLHLEKDQLYQAQEDYYHALRLQILARYRRMHMSYSSAVRFVESRIDSDWNGEVIMSGDKGTAGRKRKRITDAGKDRRPRD